MTTTTDPDGLETEADLETERGRPAAGRLRIAMTSYYLPSESKIGVGYQVHALATELERRGHDVTVYSGCRAVDGAIYRTVTVPLPHRWRTFGFAHAIRRLNLSGYDVLHAHGDDYWLWRRRVPRHIRTLHGSCFSEALRIPGAREKIRMIALGLGESMATVVADRTVLVSPQTRRWAPWVRTVIPNGIPDQFATPIETARDPEPTILFVGTYANRKRGKLLAQVFETHVRPTVPGARLVMVCDDAPRRDGVVVTGRISEGELISWYRRAWVFCLPSSYEGFGIPYAEALRAGLPVVATDNPGARFVLDRGRYGRLVPDDALGPALVSLLCDEAERNRLSRLGVMRGEEFALSHVVDRYEALYRQAAVSRARR